MEDGAGGPDHRAFRVTASGLKNVLNRANAVGFAYTQGPAYPDRLRPLENVAFLPTFGFSVEF